MRTATFVLAALLAGCATDAIRIDRASAVGSAGRAATAGTRGLLADVGAANREKLVAVAALDPACGLPRPVLAGPGRRGVGVCVPAGEESSRGDVRLARFDSRAFAPALATLEGLSAYLGALDDILTEERPDVGAEVDDAISKLQSVAGDAGAVLGVTVPTPLSDEQRKAVSGALSLLSTLANEAETVRDLRRLETPARDVEFQETLARLRAVDAGLVAILREELQQQSRVLELTRLRARDPLGGDRPRLLSDRREEMALIERRERVDALEGALGGALDALASSRDDYLALLRDGGAPLSRAEREKRARLARQRALAALNAVAGLVTAF